MIWCVEDDASIRDIELYALTSTGFEARGFDDGASFWEALQTETPELVLLDVMLPGEDGVSLLKKMKAAPALRDIPIIMATAKGAEYDKIQSLDLGADDYLVKPFEMKELMARINAVLRRSEIPDDTKKKLVFDKLEINLDSYELLVDGKKVDTVWGFDYFGDSRTVDVHIKRLREKIENVSDQWELKTVWGVGYKFEVK